MLYSWIKLKRGTVAQDHYNLVWVHEIYLTVAQLAAEISNILCAKPVVGP